MVRRARLGRRLTQAQLGQLTGYSSAQVSRYERGISPLTDVDVLRRFCTALDIPVAEVGLAEAVSEQYSMAARQTGTTAYPRLSPPKVDILRQEDDVRRRAFLALSATSAAGLPVLGEQSASSSPQTTAADALVGGIRDAMLGLNDPGSDTTNGMPRPLSAQLRLVIEQDAGCRYRSLAQTLPALIRAGHQMTESGCVPTEETTSGDAHEAVLAQAYLVATRVLIKFGDQPLGWMAADRARQLATDRDDALLAGEATRQLAVLARRSGWTDQALSIALSVADDPRLRRAGREGTAMRGLLVQSAAYTAAKIGDGQGMRELTTEAAVIAAGLADGPVVRRYVGGFTPATVALHRISAETSTGDPVTALATAHALTPSRLPTIERRARYWGDVATAQALRGDRDECLRALLAAEHLAPEETHARPAIRALISGLLMSGRTTPDLRALASRSRVSP
ncbi:hypothetical protein GCM10022223_18920 [Kineosporia mesophila]|uniref:HTH cro/C1-type domain-containing protein n=1 Tax=Kineosporia mesophila TaxID=566012 RepID=A0ABP6ZAM0_9ACTN